MQQEGAMTRWMAVLILGVAASCYGSGSDDEQHDAPGGGCGGDASCFPDANLACPGPGQPGGPSGGCELIVADMNDCPSPQELCRPDICAAHDCCFCQANGTWGTLITDCFEGCFVDAGTPPP
jgi:hypothetical protein